MKRDRRVKILATLGPASSDPETIEKLFRAGADVFRINMSHTNHERLAALVATIRSIETRVGRPVGILADLQGPKLRLGAFADGPVDLAAGALFVLDGDPTPGDAKRVRLPHPEILEAVEVGHHLLIDDGKVKLRCVEKRGHTIVATVVVAGRVSDRKGVSLPDTDLPIGALTEKDRADLDAALAEKVDWIALSFVQRPEDLAEVRKIAKGRAGIMAKIEKPQAIERLGEIIELSDAIMVARGDLGVEMPLEQVPALQKRISRACRKLGKPVVVATQMLESMINAPVPTRAEVSDVAIAVYESSDAIMLSAESAAGKYPVEAVAMMNAIAEATERDPTWRQIVAAQRTEPEATGADAITAAARQIGETLNVAAIVCLTQSGSTGLRAARERPFTPVVALTASPAMARRLALVWGVHCVVAADARDVDDMVDRACRIAHGEGWARPGQRVIVVGGVPFGTPGSTNMLRIAFVGADGSGAL
ncbi:pyruvate kinase [Pinisolibacter aquiterrae]|uniref:pyruvate kinase n=1 Tax=Pinisolibacter aquiterrae TaxID=2815579 RepID=UPI001C3D3A8B|nr:pyruvate kinase [Pinisolibacter aquiterrae]MBV5263604.1 pyruvate kinase [Pinisolibacter aquiterrae]MCC8235198.1 pyruvate kinase [Pinisolibacter aquiterrae]